LKTCLPFALFPVKVSRSPEDELSFFSPVACPQGPRSHRSRELTLERRRSLHEVELLVPGPSPQIVLRITLSCGNRL